MGQRDVAERGWTEEQVKEDIEKRLPDFSAFVDPQKANADVVLRYEPSDKGLNAKSAGELTEAMVKLKASPGSQNGTGMLQTVIAMKVREIYEKLSLQTA